MNGGRVSQARITRFPQAPFTCGQILEFSLAAMQIGNVDAKKRKEKLSKKSICFKEGITAKRVFKKFNTRNTLKKKSNVF